MFSATLDGDVDVLVRRYQREPQRCEVQTDKSDGTRTTHTFVRARREDRVAVTADLIAAHGSTLVFCRTKHGANRVADQLTRRGISAVPIHGSRSQAQRDRALRTFAAGHAQALVATDVVARGIHVDNIECVVHYDLAGDHKDYVHRSGRTGRAGATGVVVSLVTDADAAQALRLQKSVGLPLESGGSPTQVGHEGPTVPGPHDQGEHGTQRPHARQPRARSRRRTVKR